MTLPDLKIFLHDKQLDTCASDVTPKHQEIANGHYNCKRNMPSTEKIVALTTTF
jgi:hypothetical protein